MIPISNKNNKDLNKIAFKCVIFFDSCWIIAVSLQFGPSYIIILQNQLIAQIWKKTSSSVCRNHFDIYSSMVLTKQNENNNILLLFLRFAECKRCKPKKKLEVVQNKIFTNKAKTAIRNLQQTRIKSCWMPPKWFVCSTGAYLWTNKCKKHRSQAIFDLVHLTDG